jgi:hypothetical protein
VAILAETPNSFIIISCFGEREFPIFLRTRVDGYKAMLVIEDTSVVRAIEGNIRGIQFLRR